MASVAKRPDGRWRARYRDAAGREHSKHFGRRVDAQQWLDGVTTAVNTGTYADPKAGKVTVEAWAHQWLAGKSDLKPSTRFRYECLLARQVLPTWGQLPLAGVTFEGVGAWVGSLRRQGLAPATSARHTGCFPWCCLML